VGPIFPSAKPFPDKLSVTPSLSKSEPHLWDFRKCPKIHHAPERKYSRGNCHNQAITLTTEIGQREFLLTAHPKVETDGRGGATLILPGGTEAGSAETQPCRGMARQHAAYPPSHLRRCFPTGISVEPELAEARIELRIASARSPKVEPEGST
jgi:hypothetical protein